MSWPVLGCSIVAAGLWFARMFVPAVLALPADIISLVIVCAMFVWLVRRAGVHGERRGVRYGARQGIKAYRRHHPVDHNRMRPTGQTYEDAQ
jgi:hypothetical protein